MSFMSVPQAADAMALSVARVKAMLASGRLQGEKVGGRWLIPAEAIAEAERRGGHSGRPLLPRNAWSVLALASGSEASALVLEDRRPADLLDRYGMSGLAPRLERRGDPKRFRAHRGVIGLLGRERSLAPAGVSAARGVGLDLVAGEEFEAYASEGAMARLVADFALIPVARSEPSGNVLLRVVEEPIVNVLNADGVPRAAVALDLAEQADRRSRRIGQQEIVSLDRQQLWRKQRSDRQ